MTKKNVFTDFEWQLLKDSPYWLQTALTSAEGRMGMIEKRKEAQALEDGLKSYKARTELVREIVGAQDGKHKVNANTPLPEVLKTLGQIASTVESKATRDEMDELGSFLMGLGKAIAEAHSEGIFSKGAISDAEAEALEKAGDALKATAAHKAARAAAEQAARQAELDERRRKAEEAARQRAESEQKKKEAEDAQRQAEEAAARLEKAKEEARKQREEAEQARKLSAERQQRIEAAQKAREAAAKRAAEEAQAAEAAQAAQAAAQRMYEVKSGDTLSGIALQTLGNANRWQEIFELNKDQIQNPRLIRPGQKLRIPEA